METALLIAAFAVAGLACPAMMWWQRRRQAVLSARIAELTSKRPPRLAATGREPAGDG